MSSLLFIYNAKSGKLNSLFDAGHKLLNPSTYQCNLCALTFDTLTENKTWKKFRKESDLEMVFYHIDQFEKEYPDAKFVYPVILQKANTDLTEFLSSAEISTIENVEDLIKVITEKSINYFE
jgi:hypothetical protein